ncbi:MAG: serine phosphatase RsbU (regulator of sigma subunit) [Flammeovirgaceae bacterium]|jgi:serine phosphatase RsbU (regulator of sigma subunit)
MILYNLVVFVFIRDKSYIFYILFLALYTLSSATIDGSTYEFLWGNFPEWNLVATRHLLGFAWIFYLLFTRDFLNTKAQLPKWNLVLNICVVFQFGIILLNIFGIWLNWLAIIQVLTSMIVIFAVSGIIAKQGFRPAYFFLAANFCLLIVISLLALFGLGVIETNPFDYYALQIGMTFQVLLFATALADKINLMQHQIISQQKEKRQIIQEQNSELETRVKTRTEELEGKNYMLTNQKREIVIQNKELEQQNEEITAQKEMIEAQKQVVSKAYKDIKVLKEMGRKINSTLDIKEIIKIAYENISKLVTSTAFGIGTVDWDSEQIEMIGYYKHGKHFPDYYVPLSQDKRLIIWSVLNNKDVFVNDYHAEYEQYAQQKFESEMDIEIPNSLVYIPLSIKGKVIGILLVQSDDKNAFTEAQFDILKSFAEYVTVGVDHAEAYSQVKDMNKELGIKNTQIIDSLRYAKTIQDAILTDSEKFRQAFLEYFIFYHAKDVVSGDFYWLAEQKGKMLIACVDCTGHGVPGAFMSMVGHELLNEIVVQKGITDPSLVLMMLHRGVRKALQQEIGKNDDGMDMSLCVIDRKDDQEVELTFSCAKSSIFYTKDGILTESKGDRKSIGGIQKEASRKFTSQTVQLKRGDTLYLSTDGFFDQHNMDRKKFGKKQFIEMLDEIKSESFENQRAIIKDRFYDFKENQYQRDDVTVIGLKL